MALITTPDKQTGQQHTAQEYNAFKAAINENTLSLSNKASKINGFVPISELPPVYFSGVTGAGTELNPYVISGGGLSAEALTIWFRSLPNWAADKILRGDLTWIDPPTGEQLEKLASPVLSFGTPASDAIPVNWTFVANGITYTLQRDITIAFTSPINIYSGTANNFLDTGLTSSTEYYYRIRATATGFAGSNYGVGNTKTDIPGNITPVAPSTGVVDDVANTFNWTNNPSYAALSNYQFTLDGGATVADVAIKPILVGDVNKAIGQVGIRIKAAPGRNASAWLFNAVAFNKVIDTTIPIDIWRLTFDVEVDPIMNNTLNYKMPNTVGFGVGYPDLKVNSGATALLVCNGKVGTAGIGKLIFHTANDDVSNPSSQLYYLGFSDNEFGRKITTKDFVMFDVPAGVSSDLIKIRIRTDAIKIYYEYSINGGLAWVTLDSKTRTAVPLYAKVVVEDSYGLRNVNNVRHTGLISV